MSSSASSSASSSSSLSPSGIQAVVFGCSGLALTPEEVSFFKSANPAGLILFARNCQNRAQVKALTDAFKSALGRDVPVLIDQEGGTVARLKSPEWREYPSAAAIAALPDDKAREAARLTGLLMAADLAEIGVTVNCAPVLDVPSKDCHGFLADSRTYAADPARVALLGGALVEGLLAGGVTPVLKHIPGHGRATVDSHFSLPVVKSSQKEMEEIDFKPFSDLSRRFGQAVWAMTAHVVYESMDSRAPGSLSSAVIQVVRQDIGFDGLLIADDLSMKALSGNLSERARQSLAAGNDITLHCNGKIEEMEEVASGTSTITQNAAARLSASAKARADFFKPAGDKPETLWHNLQNLLKQRFVA